MNPLASLTIAFALSAAAHAELRVPASTAYAAPWDRGAKIGKDGISDWKDSAQKILWFGEIKTAGKLNASLVVRLPAGAASKLSLTVAGQTHEAEVKGGAEPATVSFGSFTIAKPGYVRFEFSSANDAGKPNADIDALVLDGPAAADAHFNTDPRRNAASVHLAYPLPKNAAVEWFYNEVTAVEDPLATYYMACGFARGYFGMQVNSATERRIIFSVWDAASGQSAKDRTTVAEENHTQLLGKGDGVVASVFGNEGTGGHSHLVYPWKTGEAQKFLLDAKADGPNTIYTGYWFHPGEKKWMLMASFRAPKDGKLLRGLYSFSENFNGANGHLQRKALYGPQWIRTADGKWSELTEATGGQWLITGQKREIRPDLIIENENGIPVAILDAKFKAYTAVGTFANGGVSREDLYQMATYLYHYGERDVPLLGLFISPEKGTEDLHPLEKRRNHAIGVLNFDLAQWDGDSFDIRAIKEHEGKFAFRLQGMLEQFRHQCSR